MIHLLISYQDYVTKTIVDNYKYIMFAFHYYVRCSSDSPYDSVCRQ